MKLLEAMREDHRDWFLNVDIRIAVCEFCKEPIVVNCLKPENARCYECWSTFFPRARDEWEKMIKKERAK